jgi:CRISPR/Cas system CMR-associated protein Cmr3 (group 5 of RAMP superfamily)
MDRSPRTKNPPKKYSPSQPNFYSQDNFLLRFEDNNELMLVKRSSIRSIVEDKASVGIGSKRRFAIIEAKGRIYTSLF